MKITNFVIVSIVFVLLHVHCNNVEASSITITDCTTLAFGATDSITLTGNNFIDTQTYSIMIGQTVQCTDMEFFSTSKISCTLDTSTLTPNAGGLSITVSFNGSPATMPVLLFKFKNPEITTAEQDGTSIVFTGTGIWPVSTIAIKLNDDPLTCVNAGYTSINCQLDPAFSSGTLTVSDMGFNFYSASFTITPILTFLSYILIPTESMAISISGNYFKSFGSNPVYVVQGGVSTIIPSANISNDGTQILFSTIGGIQEPKFISVEVVDVTSNKLPYTYQRPYVSSAVISDPETNKLSITGNNFGNNQSYITIGIGGNNLNVQFISVNHSSLEITLPNTIKKGSITLTVDGQSPTDDVFLNLPPSITTVTKPMTRGGNITVSGQYLWGTDIMVDTDALTCDNPTSEVNFPLVSVICQVNAGLDPISIKAISVLAGTTTLESSIYKVYYQPPTISNIQPKFYNLGESVNVTITGENFYQSNYVLVNIGINSDPCTIIESDYTQIICTFTAPAGNTSSIENPVPVRVSVSDLYVYDNKTFNVYKECPEEYQQCSNHGICSNITGKCACFPLYSGDKCENFQDGDSSESSESNDEVSKATSVTSSLSLIAIVSIILYLLI
ncbi:hypothetical protein DLAC_06143 [Tieghemostelium lacteum]|uniref:EGF-like domain-containing protein n=1 Tax=Tieghemostelium lacteum TaxID=361077 RepID=A0A151ZHI8_TIELA|nr:hypothetical protein DLAC_06143 [Tieghemostelium lacteum]|eukprot:KYQ93451.1 hypothetical protein DLAC_06143 [Tieghemostelium lacteum]